VLVLRPGALGDTLLALPALRSLRRSGAAVTLAAHAAASCLLASLGEVDRGLAFDDASLAWLFTDDPIPQEPTVAWLNAETLPGAQNLALVAPSRPPGVEHCARYLLRTLAPLGIDLAFDDSPLRVVPIASDEVLVHPGSGSLAKNWPPANLAAVVQRIDARVRLVVGEADRAAATALDVALGTSLPRLEMPPLEELAARLAGCRAYLGNDSGVSHLAGLCGARTVALFGPTNPAIWRPLGPNVQALDFGASPRTVVDALLG
jgi:heptosyltransferase III